MKRIVLMVTLALVTAAMMALAGPAMATIHPLSNAECANDSAVEVSNGLQEPPGISGDSQGKPPNNFLGGNFAQPVLAASGGEPFTDPGDPPPSPAFKTPGPTPEALDAYYCPAYQ